MNDVISNILPKRIIKCISEVYIESGFLEEIRIRRERQAYIVAGGKSILLDIVASESEMRDILLAMCHGSLYAYRDTIINGYISLGDGIRVGVVGRAGVENGNIVGVHDISELSIRLPNRISIDDGYIANLIRESKRISSILIYSPPGEGKTTLLRVLIKRLSTGRNALRTCVIDTREELGFDMKNKSMLVSILSGYPRRIGIEIATRCMNAQVIVCDELGDDSEASAIIDSQIAGVAMVASCHGYDIGDILSHTGILRLHNAGIFDYYVGIKRSGNLEFEYTVNSRKEADEYIKIAR